MQKNIKSEIYKYQTQGRTFINLSLRTGGRSPRNQSSLLPKPRTDQHVIVSSILINFISCLTLSRKQLPPLNKLKSLQLDDFLVDHSSFPVKQRGLLIVIVNNHKFNYKTTNSTTNLWDPSQICNILFVDTLLLLTTKIIIFSLGLHIYLQRS